MRVKKRALRDGDNLYPKFEFLLLRHSVLTLWESAWMLKSGTITTEQADAAEQSTLP
jgi:hypothetical protein